MKKLVIICGILLLAALIFIVSLPKEQRFSSSVTFDSPLEAPTRLVAAPDRWKSWWPGQMVNDSVYRYQQMEFHIRKVLLNGFQSQVQAGKLPITADFNFFVAGSLSIQCNIQVLASFSSNPFVKALQYLSWSKTQRSVTEFMKQIEQNFTDTEKVYGCKIERQQLVYTSYVSLKQSFDHDPSVTGIDSLVQELKQYIASKQGREMDAPILNISSPTPGRYDVMVAIATEKDMPSTNRYQLKNMVYGGFVMVTQVTGGRQRIHACMRELENYVLDHRKSSPAIPYEQMITRRSQVADSNQWVTKLYYPVWK